MILVKIIKFIINLFLRYRYHLLTVMLYEIYYFLFKKYDGDKFSLNTFKSNTQPIPTPYFFSIKYFFF